MGRISEALRRAGTPDSHASPSTTPEDQETVFASPWKFGDIDSLAPTEEPPRLAERPRVERAPVRLQEEPAPTRLSRPSVVERFKSEWQSRLTVGPNANSTLVDQFRRLAATLIHNQRSAQLKLVMVTSSVPDEGKTLTAINLSLVLSESYKRSVLLIDADLRRPSIGDVANLGVSDGLSEAVLAKEDRKVPLIQLTDNLTVLPAGGPQIDPLSGISSARMSRLLDEASQRFDWVIIDTPPLGAAADASLLCPMVDGALLVIRADQTAQSSIQHAIDSLGHERILGVVLNGVETRTITDYGSYYHDRDQDK